MLVPTIIPAVFDLLDYLLEHERPYLVGQEDAYEATVISFLRRLLTQLPYGYRVPKQHLDDALKSADAPYPSVPLYDVVPDIRKSMLALFGFFYVEETFFSHLRRQLKDNVEDLGRHQRAFPISEFKGTALECVTAYCKRTPLYDVLTAPVRFHLPQHTRLSHHWIVGATGSGKTNTLLMMILEDIGRMIENQCSIVVIDSQHALIPLIASLDVFSSGGPLCDRLVHIDPHDIEYPPALGLFDLDTSHTSALQQVQFQTAAVELLEFSLSALVEQDMTGQMKTLLRFLIYALMAIPDATIHTMVSLLERNGSQTYADHIQKLPTVARNFFASQFDAKEFQTSKDALLRRLYGLLANPIFERMFSHPRTKLRLKDELAAGKVILIDTAKDVFGEDGAEILGRFFISLLGQVCVQRQPDSELPCFVYIDEAGDYLSKESGFGRILDQARKKRMGFCIAHQRLSQIAPDTLDALQANTAVKYASVQDTDAHAMARNMNTRPQDIMRKRAGTFSAFVHGHTPHAVDVTFPFMSPDALPRMSETEAQDLRAVMRQSYCVSPPSSSPPSPPSPPTPAGDATTSW